MNHPVYISTGLYRVIQEERSVFWEVIISFIARKIFHVNTCLDSDWLPRLQVFESTNTKAF